MGAHQFKGTALPALQARSSPWPPNTERASSAPRCARVSKPRRSRAASTQGRECVRLSRGCQGAGSARRPVPLHLGIRRAGVVPALWTRWGYWNPPRRHSKLRFSCLWRSTWPLWERTRGRRRNRGPLWPFHPCFPEPRVQETLAAACLASASARSTPTPAPQEPETFPNLLQPALPF